MLLLVARRWYRSRNRASDLGLSTFPNRLIQRHGVRALIGGNWFRQGARREPRAGTCHEEAQWPTR
jgi:hypothetical protein